MILEIILSVGASCFTAWYLVDYYMRHPDGVYVFHKLDKDEKWEVRKKRSFACC